MVDGLEVLARDCCWPKLHFREMASHFAYSAVQEDPYWKGVPVGWRALRCGVVVGHDQLIRRQSLERCKETRDMADGGVYMLLEDRSDKAVLASTFKIASGLCLQRMAGF